jgi:tryptophanyl-tRNA synthetase
LESINLDSNPESLKSYIKSKTLKDKRKMSISKENQELIEMHKKERSGNNFIMKALKRARQREQGIESSKESEIDEDDYLNAINKDDGNRESIEIETIKEDWDWIISYYS